MPGGYPAAGHAMSLIELEPAKIVADYKDIEHIVNSVTERMDEPGLKSLIVATKVLSAKEMIELQMRYEAVMAKSEALPEELYAHTEAINFRICGSKTGLIYIRSNKLSSILPAYFHEIGHIVGKSEAVSKLPGRMSFIIDESLAELFGNWAIEELNQIATPKYESRALSMLIESILQYQPENLCKKTPERRALYDFLNWRYEKGGTSKEIYKWLKEVTCDEKRLEWLCRFAEPRFTGTKTGL